MDSRDHTVAIIGGGPAGIVTAKYLLERGFEPTIFEQSGDIGGQWNALAEHSGVWPEMRTNTSRVMTRFSDLGYDESVATYPHNREVHDYLHRYAERFGVSHLVRLQTHVEQVAEKSSGGFSVTTMTGATRETCEFGRVVLANGRYNTPSLPVIPGLESFPGAVIHSFRYKDPQIFRGKRVLVCGCSISSLEIAGDLAMLGAAKVTTAARKQRYIVPKLVAGVPTDQLAFTRWGAYAAEVFPPEVAAEGLKQFILTVAGSPEQYGALPPDPNILKAGITLSHHFLPLVAEGRIKVKPWIEHIRGSVVSFRDGTSEEFDAILLGTGFTLGLAYLSHELRRKLAVDDYEADLFNFTFSPDVEGLAAVGQFSLIGPFFPTVELQARYLAYTWAGVLPRASEEEMRAGIARDKAMRTPDHNNLVHRMLVRFARLIGAEPIVRDYPDLERAFMFGPMAAISFRICGPDKLPFAKQEFLSECARFGCMTSQELTAEQQQRMELLNRALKMREGSGQPA